MGHPKWLKRLMAIGFDVTKQDIEVAPAGIVSFGGCKVDENCATDKPGLYAAGEVGASREGAYTNVVLKKNGKEIIITTVLVTFPYLSPPGNGTV
jgi:hypothetical protein